MKEVTRMYLRCVVLERWILLYILLLIIKYVYKLMSGCVVNNTTICLIRYYILGQK